MYISSGQKKLAILGAAVLLIGGGAFVYFDPLDLNLLGLKQEAAKPAAVAPKVQPRPAKPAASAAAGAPAAEMPSAAAPAAKQAKEVAVAITAPMPAPVAAPAASPETTPVPLVAEINPPLKRSDSIKQARIKPVSPPSVDLRHCLDQPTNEDIAKCAGE